MFASPIPWLPIPGRRRRASSYDRTGGNGDSIPLPANGQRILLDHAGSPGRVLRQWFTVYTDDPEYLRNVVFTLSFDGCITAQDIPMGMLMATGPWRVNDVVSGMANVMRSGPPGSALAGIGRGSFNLMWSMPFQDRARITVHNRSSRDIPKFYYAIEYQEGEPPQAEAMPIHFTYRCASPTNRVEPADTERQATNLSDRSNYVFADIDNHAGTYVGTVLAVESHPDRPGKWWEGDDMFAIDDDTWPPSLHGSGTEDYFGMAWGIKRPYQAIDHGVTHIEKGITDHDRFYDGRYCLYRWHLNDPICFRRRLKASIESGHANEAAQHYESLAIWYGRGLG